MKRADIIKLIGVCSANYRNWPEPGKEEPTVILWERMLSDTEYHIADAAVEKYVSENKWPPTIADIREKIADLTIAREKTAIEAWEDVRMAIHKFGWYREKEAMQSFVGTTAKVVEAMSFRTICLSDNEMADRAHFLRVYDTLADRERSNALLLPSTRTIMERLQGGEGENGIRRIQ